jgi:hypothetical protein
MSDGNGRLQEGALSALKTPTNPPAKAQLVPLQPGVPKPPPNPSK